MIDTEQRLQRASELMAKRERHRVSEGDRESALRAAAARGLDLSGEQRAAFEHASDGRGLSVVVGYAGERKRVVEGKRVSVRVDPGGRRIRKNRKKKRERQK